jgi:murein DD-endopeptidase MepM/ murein hydrolase activator NlpD
VLVFGDSRARSPAHGKLAAGAIHDFSSKEPVMAKRFFTILVLPDATSPARKFQISKTVMTVVSSVVAVSILALTFFLYQYVNLNVRMLELRQLRQEASERSLLSEKVSQLEGELSKIRELDQRLRVLAGLDKGEEQPAPLAQGGSDTESRTALVDALKQRTGRVADWVNQDLTSLGEEINSRARSLRELKTYLEERAATLASTPTILPLKGLITAGYGYRKSPFTGQREFHEGLDIAAPYGTPIMATADGIVSFAGPLVAYGNVVFIDHGHGFATFYGHISTTRVREGQRVRRGDIIAYVGTTGRTTGPHVHYEVHVDGVISNPLKYAIDTSEIKFAGDVEPDSSS